MKFSRILALPLAAVADIVTLGDMGGKTYTSRVLEAQRRDDQFQRELQALKAATPIILAMLRKDLDPPIATALKQKEAPK